MCIALILIRLLRAAHRMLVSRSFGTEIGYTTMSVASRWFPRKIEYLGCLRGPFLTRRILRPAAKRVCVDHF